MTVGELLGAAGLAGAGLRPRPTQLRMAEAVAEALAEARVLLVEAPTGIGKTLAYLAPAALSGKRVLISTHTKHLQDQILDQELGRLGALLAAQGIALRAAEDPRPAELRYAVMKGRSNYVCWLRLAAQADAQAQVGFDFGGGAPPPGEGATPTEGAPPDLRALVAWAEGSPRGDRAELPGLPARSPLWDSVDARADTCIGSRCDSYERCFVTRMRQRAEQAELVVINHHLLMSDLALKLNASLRGGRSFGGVLPPAEAVIVDEAHSLEGAASEHFGGSCSSGQLARLGQDLQQLRLEQPPSAAALLGPLIDEALEGAEAVFSALPAVEGRALIRPADPRLAPARRALSGAQDGLTQLQETLEDLQRSQPQAEPLARRLSELQQTLGFVLAAEVEGFVYWWEQGRRGRHLGASPVEVGGLLSQFLYPTFEATVLTSATLSAGSAEAGYIRAALGVPAEAQAQILRSPFDFAQRAALYLPLDALPADHPEATAWQAEQILQLVGLLTGGALVLCTSHRAMQALYARLSGRLDRPLLMQGQAPRRQLVAALKAQAPAVLIGTASFWEGVDVPGPALQLVVIDRLPFESPADPIARAKAEAAARGGRSAFAAVQLPRAVLRLQQGFGRLIRDPEDAGVVAILDRRLRDRGYGRRFLAALPPAARIEQLGALRAWCEARGLATKPG